MKLIALIPAAAILIAATPPTDRPYIMAHTDRAPAEVAACTQGLFAGIGAADNTPVDYGFKVDYRYKNLGGAVKEPTMTLEVHSDGSLVLYGFGTWKGAIKSTWKKLSGDCFADAAGAQVVKPAKG